MNVLPLLTWLLDASLKGSVVIALAAMMIFLVGRRLGARWRHALWLVVLVRLALPVAPSSSWSIFNLLQFNAVPAPAPAPLPPLRMAGLGGVTSREVLTFRPAPLAAAGGFFLSVWLAGFLLLMLRSLVSAYRFRRAVVRALRRGGDDPILRTLVDEACRKLGVRRHVRVVTSELVKTPALHGLFHPTLLLPSDLPATFGREEQRHVVLHELWHLRRFDVAINWVLSTLQAIHWFNPLVWFAVARIKEEREICCDELALSCLEEEERSRYGRTILKLLEHFRTAVPVPALVGIVNHKQQMKRRLMMIASFQNRTRFSVLFLGAVALIGTVAFTDARGAQKRIIKDGAACAMFGKLDQKVSLDLTGATFGELLSAVASKTNSAVTQGPELATLPVQQARFTVHASNVPAHMLLMEALMPFELSPKSDANGVTIEKGATCSMIHHAMESDTETESDGKVEKRVVKIITGDSAKEGAEAEMKAMHEAHHAMAGENEERVMVRAMGQGDCKLSADGKLHRDVTIKFDENGTLSQGRLQLDIDAPPSTK